MPTASHSYTHPQHHSWANGIPCFVTLVKFYFQATKEMTVWSRALLLGREQPAHSPTHFPEHYWASTAHSFHSGYLCKVLKATLSFPWAEQNGSEPRPRARPLIPRRNETCRKSSVAIIKSARNPTATHKRRRHAGLPALVLGPGPGHLTVCRMQLTSMTGWESGLYSQLFIRRIRMASNLWMTFSFLRYLKLLLQIECVLNIYILNLYYLWTQQYV